MREEKRALRRKLKGIRDSIPESLRKSYSENILLNLDKISEYRNAERVLLFADNGSEVHTDDIFLSCINRGKSVYYPKVAGEEMRFFKVSRLNDLHSGYKAIREPAGTWDTVFPEKTADMTDISDNTEIEKKVLTVSDKLSGTVIICPGLGFTKSGERIGYGGGYYDRFLSRYPGIYRIGICFSVQLCDSIPTDEKDHRMNKVVTECSIY